MTGKKKPAKPLKDVRVKGKKAARVKGGPRPKSIRIVDLQG